MDVKSEDGIFAPGALQPRNLGLQLELRRRRFAGLLLFLVPRGLLGCGSWCLLLLRWLGRQRALLTRKARWFRVRLGVCWLVGPRLGGVGNCACGIGSPVLGIACAEAVVVAEAVVGALAEWGARGFAGEGVEGGAVVAGRRARRIAPGRGLGGVFRVVY